SPDSKQVIINAAQGNGDNNWYFPQLDTIDVGSGKLQSILKADMQMKDPRWSPDGKYIAYIGGIMAGDLVGNSGDVYVIPAEGGRTRNLTPQMKATAYRLNWVAANRILFRDFVDGDIGLTEVDLQGEIKPLWRGAEFSAKGGWIEDIALTSGRKTSAVVLRSLDRPAEIWAGAIGAWKQITHVNQEVHPTPPRIESLHWTSDQWRIQGWLTYPRNYDPKRQYPMVVFIHGGPSGMVGAGCGGAFAAQGYFVLCPNFRGSAGFGEEFLRADFRDFGYGDLRDILAGVNKVLETLPVDRNRIGITGHSYGGYMSMWAVTQTNVFHASAASAGISDWLSYVGEAGISNWVIPYFGVSIYDNRAIYARTAPMSYIKNVKTPTLILVGAEDGECPATQSIEFWNALKSLGVKTRLVLYPNEGHAMSQGALRDRTLREIEWFNEYLK
ncbi:MAG: S9 family peptidase, partial [Terriglobales bacterium]